MTQSDSFYCFPQEDRLMIPTPQFFLEQISVVLTPDINVFYFMENEKQRVCVCLCV